MYADGHCSAVGSNDHCCMLMDVVFLQVVSNGRSCMLMGVVQQKDVMAKAVC